jgi:hypothetical protein
MRNGEPAFDRTRKTLVESIKAVVKNGRIDQAAPPDWPEGCEVIIEPLPDTIEKVGRDESEWRDDPAALADWDAWLKTIEPFDVAPEDEAALGRFDDEMRRFNLEAVRRQMEETP